MNYQIKNTLASGSTSKVKVVTLGDYKYAAKIMEKDSPIFKKEVKILKTLNHSNIIHLVDSYSDSFQSYIIMDLGICEVSTLIQKDVGLDGKVAHFFFYQLISALKYIHSKGICHRDIKPDNFLLSRSGNLLLGDFGYSTCSVYKERKRRLKSLAGSYEYMAPEVLQQSYDGEAVDVWSTGVSLIVLLTGTIPWDSTHPTDEKYSAFISLDYHYYSPFSRIRKKATNLIKNILKEEKERIGIGGIEEDPWYTQENSLIDPGGLCSSPEVLFSLLPTPDVDLLFSQPEMIPRLFKPGETSSQPHQNRTTICKMQRRGGVRDVMEKVCQILEGMVVQYERMTESSLIFQTVDSKRLPLRGQISMREGQHKEGHTKEGQHKRVLVTLEKIKGDSGEFEKFFNIINSQLG